MHSAYGPCQRPVLAEVLPIMRYHETIVDSVLTRYERPYSPQQKDTWVLFRSRLRAWRQPETVSSRFASFSSDPVVAARSRSSVWPLRVHMSAVAPRCGVRSRKGRLRPCLRWSSSMMHYSKCSTGHIWNVVSAGPGTVA